MAVRRESHRDCVTGRIARCATGPRSAADGASAASGAGIDAMEVAKSKQGSERERLVEAARLLHAEAEACRGWRAPDDFVVEGFYIGVSVVGLVALRGRVVIRKRVVCPCSRESEAITDEQRRALGWRLVPAVRDIGVASEAWPYASAGDVFVWACPACVSLRNALLAKAAAS